MITLNLAYTEPVHGPNPSIWTLTQEQVWKGLELKVRRPQEFIPAIDDCRVIEERDHGAYILREAHVATDLRQSPMAGQYVREECILHRPIWVSRNRRTVRTSSAIRQLTRLHPPLRSLDSLHAAKRLRSTKYCLCWARPITLSHFYV